MLLKSSVTIFSSIARYRAFSISSAASVGMKVLVGGGTGFIGKSVKRALEEDGHEVTVISRSAGRGKITWDDISKNGLPECQAVVNLAGENLLNPLRRWNAAFKEDVRKSRIKTTRLLATKIAESSSPPEVFVSSSAVGFYPPSSTVKYTEDSPPSQADWMSRLCVDWEDSAKLPDGCKTRLVTVRIGVVLGHEGGVIQNTIWPFWFGVGGRLGSGQQYFPWIHVRDLAGIFSYAMVNQHVTGILNGVSPQVATNEVFTAEFASALHRWAILPVPSFALSLMLGGERASVMLEGQHVSPVRTLETGYEFQFPELKDALIDIVS